MITKAIDCGAHCPIDSINFGRQTIAVLVFVGLCVRVRVCMRMCAWVSECACERAWRRHMSRTWIKNTNRAFCRVNSIRKQSFIQFVCVARHPSFDFLHDAVDDDDDDVDVDADDEDVDDKVRLLQPLIEVQLTTLFRKNATSSSLSSLNSRSAVLRSSISSLNSFICETKSDA